MTIWGHSTVHIENDEDKREWRVFTASVPRQLLVTIPWVDAFDTKITEKSAPDYYRALLTCVDAFPVTPELAYGGVALTNPSVFPNTVDTSPGNVVNIADFRRRR